MRQARGISSLPFIPPNNALQCALSVADVPLSIFGMSVSLATKARLGNSKPSLRLQLYDLSELSEQAKRNGSIKFLVDAMFNGNRLNGHYGSL